VPLLLFAVPVLSTLLGGLLALRLRRWLPLLIAVGAGLLLGAAFLDLLPEALELGSSTGFSAVHVLGLTLLSFLLFHAVESGLDAWGERLQQAHHGRRIARRTGALMLIFHSFRDGMAIGVAYAASHGAGYAVAVGIAAHDLGDGLNTVILSTDGEKPTRTDYLFLLADAFAPFAGGLLTAFLAFSARSSVWLLALAAGFFLQMATGDFLPELRRGSTPRKQLLPLVMLGCAIIYVANLLILHSR
jgi:zinc and cadmium transporter